MNRVRQLRVGGWNRLITALLFAVGVLALVSAAGTMEARQQYGSVEVIEGAGPARVLLQNPPPGTEVPFPTETDPLAEERATAWQFVSAGPETGDPVTVVTTITQYLQDEDPIIRNAGAAAVSRVALSSEAASSGLRETVRSDAELVAALFDTVSYEYNIGYDDKRMRVDAVRAVAGLWFDAPSSTVETALTDRYADELVTSVRSVIVATLCEHGYTSTATEAAILDATEDFDAKLAQRAQTCFDRLFP